MTRRNKWISDRLPPGRVTIPKPGHAYAGFVTFGFCDYSSMYRDAKWFIDCCGHIKFSKLRRFINVHHQEMSKDEWWNKVAERMLK